MSEQVKREIRQWADKLDEDTLVETLTQLVYEKWVMEEIEVDAVGTPYYFWDELEPLVDGQEVILEVCDKGVEA